MNINIDDERGLLEHTLVKFRCGSSHKYYIRTPASLVDIPEHHSISLWHWVVPSNQMLWARCLECDIKLLWRNPPGEVHTCFTPTSSMHL